MSELYILYSEIAVAFIAMQLTAVGRKDETRNRKLQMDKRTKDKK